MKIVSGLLAATILISVGCKKQETINEAISIESDPVSNVRTRFPRVPRVAVPLTRCIYSYSDVLDALGTNTVTAISVVLANGIAIQPGINLRTIKYEAGPQTQANSLFGSS